VQPPSSENAIAVWTIDGNPNDSFVCTLSDSGRVVSGPHSCGVNPTYDMTNLAPGDYTLSVVQIGAENVRSAPGTATWFWPGLPHPGPPGGGGHHPKKPPAATKPPGGNPLASLPPFVRKTLQKTERDLATIPWVHPIIPSDAITNAVSTAVRGVVHAVGSAGGGTGFPLLLLGLVFVFLIVQNRIDRRDPKLALASIAADDTVEFQPPPSRGDRP
jgi:hypothetical protein